MASTSRKLLIVEDDPGLQSQLRWCFDGYEVLLAEDRNSALAELRRSEPPVVTLDLGLPPDPANVSEGLAALEQILELSPETKVIVVTGNDDRENAIRAVGMGAYDFYQKPVDADVLRLIVDRAYKVHELEQENRKLMSQGNNSILEGIIATGPEMIEVCRMVEKVAPSEVSVLVLGESGTGKELLARALHELNPRRKGKFVAINCAAIPDNLLESELFGYEKGAFTGAAKQTRGKFEYADGGTLFLDEIGDLPMPLQAKLLRFLQERVLERVGGREEIPVDVRIVCATHRDVSALIKDEIFREDLYYRIGEVTIKVPPLRERSGDATVLAHSFLQRYADQYRKSLRGFTEGALAAIDAFAWPGNARELENRVKRATVMAEGKLITAADLDLEEANAQALPLNLKQVREEAEKSAISKALGVADGNVSQAADLLGVTRPTLYSLTTKYGLK